GLERLLRPANRLGVPVHDLAMMMTIALRFIPTLMEEADRIIKAQTARGADFQQGGPLQRVRSLVPVLVPLFVSAFRRADDLALAMEARGYRGGEGRTRFKQLRLGPRDAAAAVAALSAAAVSIRLGRSAGGDGVARARRLKLTLAYDGTAFHGFQIQGDRPTVQLYLEQALSRVAGHPVRVTAAGRTDAGVHAAGQVVHADIRGRIPTERIP